MHYVPQVKWKHRRYKKDLFQTCRDESYSIFVENAFARTNSRLDIAGKRTRELQDIAVEE